MLCYGYRAYSVSIFMFFLVQAEEVEAVLANTKQILNQFLQKSRILFEVHITLIY